MRLILRYTSDNEIILIGPNARILLLFYVITCKWNNIGPEYDTLRLYFFCNTQSEGANLFTSANLTKYLSYCNNLLPLQDWYVMYLHACIVTYNYLLFTSHICTKDMAIIVAIKLLPYLSQMQIKTNDQNNYYIEIIKPFSRVIIIYEYVVK